MRHKAYSILGVLILIILGGIILPSQSQVACADGECPEGFPPTKVSGEGEASQAGGQHTGWTCPTSFIGTILGHCGAAFSPLTPEQKKQIEEKAEKNCNVDLQAKTDAKYEECKNKCEAEGSPCTANFMTMPGQECDATCGWVDPGIGLGAFGISVTIGDVYKCTAKGSKTVRCDCIPPTQIPDEPNEEGA